ncbi:3'-5' exonuclease [Streptomyces roseoverticillatus]|uniref:3'-5' exonuclease n=1 Tax=Streptomyces roseoverticillatus TaxID=66429 RepID=UPI0009965DAF|nr:3'-5' exonuclease [Streptomyces roseoverticillatus]
MTTGLDGKSQGTHNSQPAAWRSAVGGRLAEIVREVNLRSWVAARVAPSEIAVCARFHTHTARIRVRLAEAGLPVVRVKDGEPDGTAGVRVSSLHSLKGLEFRCVAVAGVTASAFPFQKAVTPAEVVDPLQHATDFASERCLLFVACTRAREALYVSYSGRPSTFLCEQSQRS